MTKQSFLMFVCGTALGVQVRYIPSLKTTVLNYITSHISQEQFSPEKIAQLPQDLIEELYHLITPRLNIAIPLDATAVITQYQPDLPVRISQEVEEVELDINISMHDSVLKLLWGKKLNQKQYFDFIPCYAFKDGELVIGSKIGQLYYFDELKEDSLCHSFSYNASPYEMRAVDMQNGYLVGCDLAEEIVIVDPKRESPTLRLKGMRIFFDNQTSSMDPPEFCQTSIEIPNIVRELLSDKYYQLWIALAHLRGNHDLKCKQYLDRFTELPQSIKDAFLTYLLTVKAEDTEKPKPRKRPWCFF